MKRNLFLIILFVVFFNYSHGQFITPNQDKIVFMSGALSLKTYLTTNNFKDELFYIQQNETLKNSIHPNWKEVAQLPNGIKIVRFSQALTENDWTSANIQSWGIVQPKHKISPLLFNSLTNEKNSSLKSLIAVCDAEMDSLKLNAQIDNFSGSVVQQLHLKNAKVFEIILPANEIEILAKSASVLYLQEKLTPQSLNNQAIGMTNAATAHAPMSIGGWDLSGKDVTVGVGDNGDVNHIDFIDRVKRLNPIFNASHAFHTTGTVGGAGIQDERYAGFAPKVDLISDYFSQVIFNTPIYRNDFNMNISSNSYGLILGNCDYAGTYDVYSQYLDQLSVDYPDVLHVFAAANDGALNCQPYPTGYATVTASYASSKNPLIVANIGKTRTTFTTASSKGPVKDGRIKPEITAIGTRLISTTPNNNYGANTGTSMATPNVAGAAALLTEQYKKRNNNELPPNALLKNLLINGALDIDLPGPDYRFGYGLMNVSASLQILENQQYYSNQIQQNQWQSFPVTVTNDVLKLKVFLNWNDPANLPLSLKTLVNDLDLKVVTPTGDTILPLILNPDPAHVTDIAINGVDTVNNTEQVTIIQPQPGTYQVLIKGSLVAAGQQEYFVSYDFEKTGITLQYPIGSEALIAGDSIYIYWQTALSQFPFDIQFSSDNGTSWQTLSSNIDGNDRAYVWHVPNNVYSSKCLIKINRGSENVVSHPFTILKRPVAQFFNNSSQCPGSVSFHWTAIAGVDSYQVFRKIGAEMKAIASTTDTFFIMNSLSADSTYWVAVAGMKEDQLGPRSIAISRKASGGNCSLVAAHGDLKLNKIIEPKSGRMFTASQLSNAQPLHVSISNLDNQVANNYKISYQINNEPWVTKFFTAAIQPGASKTVSLENVDFGNVDTYHLQIAIENIAISDPVNANDTLRTSIVHLPNLPIDLDNDFIQDFEDFDLLSIEGSEQIGVGNSYWDFETDKATGRLQSFVNSGVVISGQRSISLDNSTVINSNFQNSSQNSFIGTFNLSNYASSNQEIRAEFDFVLSGVPKFDTGNLAWIRGSDQDSWLPLHQFYKDTLNNSAIEFSGSLSLTDVLDAAGQNWSSSTQIKFDQKDTSKISQYHFGNGLTIDNFKIYKVQNDVQLLSIESLQNFNCNLGNQVPLTIKIRNGVNQTVQNIKASYSLNGGPVESNLIASIAGKDTLLFTFSSFLDLSTIGAHTLSVWIEAPDDSYPLNDSLLNYQFYNQSLISNFPYLEDFENGDGGFYTVGYPSSSWEYGNPASNKINRAASGTKAWKTNLTGNYNDQEIAYLYSPCFDISTLQQPQLSLSIATDIEEPSNGNLWDHAYVEYTTNGKDWIKLLSNGNSYQWYDNENYEVWANLNRTYWHVATAELPQVAGPIAFRFVMKSDQASNFEGMAIDDIHIYDLIKPIFEGDSLNNLNSVTLQAGEEKNMIHQNKILLNVINGNQVLDNFSVQSYNHVDFIDYDSNQYYLPRSFVVKSTTALIDSIQLRFYVLDEAMKRLREDFSCYSCASIQEVYELGMTQYHDNNPTNENNSLIDNLNGDYHFYPKDKLRWVPYDKGYYAEIKVNSLSEFWFNSGGPDGDSALPNQLFDFKVEAFKKRYAALKWKSQTDVSTTRYEIQRAITANEFETIAEMDAMQQNLFEYNYIDTPFSQNSMIQYRILHHHINGKVYSSLIRTFNISDDNLWMNVYPNPITNSSLKIEWMKANNESIQYSLLNSIGQEMMKGTIEDNRLSGTYILDLSKIHLSSGVYILKLKSGTDHWEFKLVSY